MHPDDGTAVERFFAAVSDALQPLAPERRAEILADLRAHTEIRRRQSSLDIQALLAELGTPEQIAAEAGLEGAVARTGPGTGARDIWSLIVLTATVLAWPLGIVLAAASGRWRARAVAYAAITTVLGWGVDLLAVVPITSFTQQTTCQQGVCVTTPVHFIHPFLRGLAVAGGGTALVVGLVGTPIVSAVYLAQTERNPEARPWLPVITWTVILVGAFIARQWMA